VDENSLQQAMEDARQAFIDEHAVDELFVRLLA
jgi:hypothetical protein